MGKKVKCPECRGTGGETIPVLPFGIGPWMECALCEGHGKITRSLLYFYYKEIKADVR